MEQPRTREQLYEQIREKGSKDIFVLEEMIRLGFWKEGSGLPDDPAEEIRRSAELQAELNKLRGEQSKFYNEEVFLKDLRKKRLAESREKQKQTKERRKKEKAERAEAWRKRKETDILFLGERVSGGLNNFETDEQRLSENNLPVFKDFAELADALKITVGKLRFLAFSREVSEKTNYINFQLPKKTGGFRKISAPMPDLKAAQIWILENILNAVKVHEAAHGFLPKKNIVSNAEKHVGAQIVVNFDLENFFPTITYNRVKGIFRSFGYSEAIATTLTLICTAPETEEVEIDGKTFFVAVGERALPQGSPASPMISNIVSRRLDKSLSKIAENLQFQYTRYADDLTFSAENKDADVSKLMTQIRYVVDKQGFKVNESKTRVLRKGRQQEVTGIVVNEKISLDRKTLRKFRAVLHQAETKGLENLSWGNSLDLISSLKGYANFVLMVDKEKGHVFQQQVRRIAEKYNWQPPSPPVYETKKKPTPIDEELTPKIKEEISVKEEKPWWKLW